MSQKCFSNKKEENKAYSTCNLKSTDFQIARSRGAQAFSGISNDTGRFEAVFGLCGF